MILRYVEVYDTTTLFGTWDDKVGNYWCPRPYNIDYGKRYQMQLERLFRCIGVINPRSIDLSFRAAAFENMERFGGDNPGFQQGVRPQRIDRLSHGPGSWGILANGGSWMEGGRSASKP